MGEPFPQNKKMDLAFNQHREFQVDEATGEMVRFQVRPTEGRSISAWNWEIVQTFLDKHHITPHWINCNGSWGSQDKETLRWGGAVGQIEQDKADLAVQGFNCVYGRSVQALCLPVGYNPFNWFTRYPQKALPYSTWSRSSHLSSGC